MRAAWWWIDRWRKSTAYIEMNLEEQGLYRNLLDAIWLFEDGIIPDTPKALITASGGDSEAWERSGQNVLRWMQRSGRGWTHETALEIKAKTQDINDKRAESGRLGGIAKAKRLASVLAKDVANSVAKGLAETCPPSPSPSPLPLPSPTPQRKRKAPAAVSPDGSTSPAWNREAAEAWISAYGGEPLDKYFGEVKRLVRRFGWERVGPVLRHYLSETPSEYADLSKLRSAFGDWESRSTGRARVSAKAKAREESMMAFIHGGSSDGRGVAERLRIAGGKPTAEGHDGGSTDSQGHYLPPGTRSSDG